MKHRRSPLARWYAPALAVLLLAGCLVMSVGVSWARYRTDADAIIPFEARKPLAVCLGRMEYGGEDPAGTFVPADVPAWEWVDGSRQMTLVVANGTAPDQYEAKPQAFHVRFVGSLGAWSGDGTAAISLILPPKETEEPDATEETTESTEPILPTVPVMPERVDATAVRISPDTRLYLDFGDGWLFYFLDARGEELSWTLDGGRLSCVELNIAVDSGALVDTSLLQMQIVED